MRFARRLVLALVLAALAGCIQPYRLEVRQGNVVTPEMIQLLKPGMTRNQVRFALGTPLIADPFHRERWDYVYLYKAHAQAPPELRRLTVVFDGERLERVEGDLAPAHGMAGGDATPDAPPAAPSG
jgi:outer membrane protein assembly factor BamE